VDGAVRTPGRGSAALPDTGHCRSRPDGRTRTPMQPAAATAAVRAPAAVVPAGMPEAAISSAALINAARVGADTSVQAGHTGRAFRTPAGRDT
jgi:hypothetical protein